MIRQSPPRKKRNEDRNAPEIKEGRPQEPAAAERTGDEGSTERQMPAGQTETTYRTPITNQDEQEKITNAGAGEEPVADN